jgi:recombination protein RecR
MSYKLDAFEDMVNAFKIFPGIGTKTAERMALYLLKAPLEKTQNFSQMLRSARQRIRFCSQCHLFTEVDPCTICQDPRRDRDLICVVEEPKDVLTLERSGGFKGLYHALMGKISPLDGIGPENLEIAHLMQRVKNHRPKEVILATGMDVEGEATALYLSKLLRAQGIMITRIAYGIPVGMGLDYADELTLARALEARRSL